MPLHVTAGRKLAIAGLLALAAFAPVAQADAPKIAYFDVKRVLAEADEAKAAKARLEEDFKKKQKELDEKREEIEKAQKDFEQKAPVMSQSAKEQAQAEFIGKMQNAQKRFAELQQELGMKEQQALGDLIEKLQPVVKEIADAEGYNFVFEKNEAGLFYGPSADDLTTQIIRKYNQRNPPKGGGAAKQGEKKSGDKK